MAERRREVYAASQQLLTAQQNNKTKIYSLLVFENEFAFQRHGFSCEMDPLRASRLVYEGEGEVSTFGRIFT